MSPVVSPRAPTPLPACQAVFPMRGTLTNDSLLQSFLGKLMSVTRDDTKDDKQHQPRPDKLKSKQKARGDALGKLHTAVFREYMTPLPLTGLSGTRKKSIHITLKSTFLSCYCNGLSESPVHQQAYRTACTYTRTHRCAHTSCTLHLDTKYLPRTRGTHRLPVFVSLCSR